MTGGIILWSVLLLFNKNANGFWLAVGLAVCGIGQFFFSQRFLAKKSNNNFLIYAKAKKFVSFSNRF